MDYLKRFWRAFRSDFRQDCQAASVITNSSFTFGTPLTVHVPWPAVFDMQGCIVKGGPLTIIIQNEDLTWNPPITFGGG